MGYMLFCFLYKYSMSEYLMFVKLKGNWKRKPSVALKTLYCYFLCLQVTL